MNRERIKKSKRLVVKVGTSSLVLPSAEVNLRAIDQLAFTLSALRQVGYEIILVSSGAIAVGMDLLKIEKRPQSIATQQAVAAVGQSELIKIYTQRFASYHQLSAQVLLTRDVVDFPVSRQNAMNTFEELIAMNIIPIVNENDSVSVDELDHLTKFGDNDQLSAIVCELSKGDCLIMLSDIDGFYDDNPQTNETAKLYPHISKITPAMETAAGGKGSDFGTGGMYSKLKAAERILNVNGQMVLTSGANPAIIFDILKGDNVGTLFSLTI